MKAPWLENYELCYEKNIHHFIKYHDGTMRCFYCGKTLGETREKVKK